MTRTRFPVAHRDARGEALSPYPSLFLTSGKDGGRRPVHYPLSCISFHETGKNPLLFFHSCGIIIIRDLYYAHDVSSVNGRTSPCGAIQF